MLLPRMETLNSKVKMDNLSPAFWPHFYMTSSILRRRKMAKPKALVQTFVLLATIFSSQSNLISPFLTSLVSLFVSGTSHIAPGLSDSSTVT